MVDWKQVSRRAATRHVRCLKRRATRYFPAHKAVADFPNSQDPQCRSIRMAYSTNPWQFPDAPISQALAVEQDNFVESETRRNRYYSITCRYRRAASTRRRDLPASRWFPQDLLEFHCRVPGVVLYAYSPTRPPRRREWADQPQS